jgi:hypothetical protein
MIVPEAPQNLVGDNAYDSDKLDVELRQYGTELIAPHRSNRRNLSQDLRRMRRYRRRWKIERLFAWLQNFRRLVVRYERYAENFLGMLYRIKKDDAFGTSSLRRGSPLIQCRGDAEFIKGSLSLFSRRRPASERDVAVNGRYGTEDEQKLPAVLPAVGLACNGYQ